MSVIMDLIGARIVQPPEAVAHGTDSHTVPNKSSLVLLGSFFLYLFYDFTILVRDAYMVMLPFTLFFILITPLSL